MVYQTGGRVSARRGLEDGGKEKGASDRCAFCAARGSVLPLSRGFRLLLALYAGLLVMLALAHLGQDAAAGTLALEAFQSALKRFVFLYTNLRHCFPPLRTSRLDNTVFTADGDCMLIIPSRSDGVNQKSISWVFSELLPNSPNFS